MTANQTTTAGHDIPPGYHPPGYQPQAVAEPPPDPIGTITPEEGQGLARALILIDRGIRKAGYAGPPGHGLALALAALAQSSLGVTTPPLPAPPANGAPGAATATAATGSTAMTGATSELSHRLDKIDKELDDLAANYDSRLSDIEKEIGLDHAKKPAAKK